MFGPSLFFRTPKPRNELDALLARMRQRAYSETTPVLASYWLRTLCAAGHNRIWWKELYELSERALLEQQSNDSVALSHGDGLNAASRESLVAIHNWIQSSGVLADNGPKLPVPRMEPFRSNLEKNWLIPYISRLLNEWLPAEVAWLLVNQTDSTVPADIGVPALATGKALERLLIRQRLSPQTLEMLLQPGLLSPQCAYPADVEMLVDVVSALLGRTSAPALPVMPAVVLGVPADSPLAKELRPALQHASLVPYKGNDAQHKGSDEIHVPLPPALAQNILHSTHMRIASVLVTLDGRLWLSDNLQGGEKYLLVYRSYGRLRMDQSGDHVKLKVPWPETQLQWSGTVHFAEPFEIFGREWHASRWETDASGTFLHLEFSRVLPVAGDQPAVEKSFRRSRPAVVDIAWTALENALAASIEQKNPEPVEQLRRGEFVPLGRALLGLAETMTARWSVKRETMETQLNGIRYLVAGISVEYGKIPWRILPEPLHAALLKRRSDAELVELLNQVFDSLPESLSTATAQGPLTPSQAA